LLRYHRRVDVGGKTRRLRHLCQTREPARSVRSARRA
jgi:hypothetical protein